MREGQDMACVRLENAIEYLKMWARQKRHGKLFISYTNGTITSIRHENVMKDEDISREIKDGNVQGLQGG